MTLSIFAQEIVSYLGVDLGKILIKHLRHVLGAATCNHVNGNLMDLFIMIDSC
jgi:hypothetical protein